MIQDGEHFDVAVVVHDLLAVGGEVIRVDHVHIVEVRSRGFVGDVDGMVERQVPDGERLVFRVAGADSTLVIVVQLRETGGHLPAARPWGCDDHDVTLGLDVVVLAESRIAHRMGHVVGIALDEVVPVHLQAETLELASERARGGVVLRCLREDNTTDVQIARAETVDEPQHVRFVGDAEVGTLLLAGDVLCADDDDDLDVVSHRLEHVDLVVGRESWQDSGGVHVVEQLASELQVELSAELRSTGGNVFRLQFQILRSIKPGTHAGSLSPPIDRARSAILRPP